VILGLAISLALAYGALTSMLLTDSGTCPRGMVTLSMHLLCEEAHAGGEGEWGEGRERESKPEPQCILGSRALLSI
jgi:hypothetical protein